MTDISQIINYGTPIFTTIGVVIAIYSVMCNTENAKKRATIDMIMSERNNVDLQEAIARVNEMAKTEGFIFAAYMSETKENQVDRKHIIKVLNQREFVSVGVLGGALHEKMYKEFQYSMLLRDWGNLSGFILELRRLKKSPTAFQEFEALAKKWKREPLKVKH